MRLKKCKKTKYLLINGPLNGHSLFLTQPKTLTFVLDKQTGFYATTKPDGTHCTNYKALIWNRT